MLACAVCAQELKAWALLVTSQGLCPPPTAAIDNRAPGSSGQDADSVSAVGSVGLYLPAALCPGGFDLAQKLPFWASKQAIVSEAYLSRTAVPRTVGDCLTNMPSDGLAFLAN